MPAGDRKRYRKNKRNYKRLFYKKRPYRMTRIARQPRLGVASQQMVTLRYVDNLVLDPTIATIASHMYNCNGVYDPDQTGVGHQPRMFDQWMTFYSHCVVIGSKITIHALNAGTTGASNQIVGVRISPNTTSYAVPNEYLEDEWSKYKTLGLTGAGQQTITHKFSPKTFLGRSKPLSDPQLKNSASANCTENAFFDVFACSINGSDDPSGVDVLVVIDYICMFIEPLHVGQS